ncbi:MAG: replication and repair protein RecF [Ignavibacteria bacterium]|nr:replication and repair protein RecF [Ignavibacteria bacterium]
MRISKLIIDNLRNHEHTELHVSDGLNVIFGSNGEGKTTILEAISICSFSKSFLPTSDSSLIQNGVSQFTVSITAENDMKLPYKAGVQFAAGARKKIHSSYGDNLTPKDIIGCLPTVALSPDFKSLTFGAPSDRRSFIDRLLSQSSRTYMDNIYRLNKCLKQRNSLLSSAKSLGATDMELLDSWTEEMIKSSVEIISRRSSFINEFIPVFNRYYEIISGGKEQVSIKYEPSRLDTNDETLEKEKILQVYNELAQKLRKEEMRRGITLFGPQKDELKIMINSGVAKEYASQGQHKSLLISIKFAEFEYLKESTHETPVFLLDDIFSELDSQRSEKIISLLKENSAQTFITITNPQRLISFIPASRSKFFKVAGGVVQENGDYN